ncbi:hypothetical protein ACXM0N_13540 [Peribacillus simplex]
MPTILVTTHIYLNRLSGRGIEGKYCSPFKEENSFLRGPDND